jgi:hypothetical protein
MRAPGIFSMRAPGIFSMRALGIFSMRALGIFSIVCDHFCHQIVIKNLDCASTHPFNIVTSNVLRSLYLDCASTHPSNITSTSVLRARNLCCMPPDQSPSSRSRMMSSSSDWPGWVHE